MSSVSNAQNPSQQQGFDPSLHVDGATDSGRVTIDLSGQHWKMEGFRPGQGEAEGVHDVPSEYQGIYFSWNQASVPGDVFTDLQRAGEIDDPLVARNFHRAKWVQHREWWYVRKFNLPEGASGKRIRLEFEGVDYSFEAWLNGKSLGTHAGMFSPHVADITDLVRHETWFEGANILMIRLDPGPMNIQNTGGSKPVFQGDYMTGVVPTGIWRPVKVVMTGDVHIDHVRIDTPLPSDPADADAGVDTVAKVVVELDSTLTNAADVAMTVVARPANEAATGGGETTLTHRVEPGQQHVELELPLKDVRRWWPWDMGGQPLYHLTVRTSVDGVAHDEHTQRFGVREVTMTRNPGYNEDEAEFPWTFNINGRPTFLRSACWGGPPSILYGRNPREKYVDRLGEVREANINNLRIFGWHPPEVPEFYDLCDELGITVWTNFCFATQAYKATPEFMKLALGDCIAAVKDRRHHPSNIFWMGGEEVFFSHAHAESDNRHIMEAVGEEVANLTDVPYNLASPLSETFGQKLGFKPHDSRHANGHYYGAGNTLMEEFYPSLDYCVIPELTAASAPNVASLRKFIPESELWPPGPSWGYHGADLDVLRVLNAEVFGDTRMESVEQFAEATQIAQGQIFQFALEALRRRKPKVSAVALCHFITNWPDVKWGLVDYYGEKKLSFDYVKRCYQPLVPSLDYDRRRWSPGEPLDARVWIVNDLHESFDGVTVDWRCIVDGSEKASGQATIDIASNSSAEVCPIDWTVDGNDEQPFEVHMRLSKDGKTLAENHHVLLVGDQAAAKAKLKALADEVANRKQAFGKSYYRYHPELWNL
ncbi:MAG: sugar-binding domain-containing protein [Planctomycetota bacterium]